MSTHSHAVTMIPGDGIGPEVTEAAVKVVEAAGVRIEWNRVEAGAEVVAKHGTPVPDEVLNAIRRTGVALKGPITTPIGQGFQSANVTLRKALDLYACIRPVKSIPGVPSRFENVNLIVVRENTEGLYSGLEHRIAPGIVESLKIVTEKACSRISRYAFELAERQGRKKVTAIHKANIMKLADGLFLDCAREVAKRHEGEVAYDEVLVDALCMKLVRRPGDFDVLLLENLYGDIVSDLAAGLVGGLGLVPGGNYGRHAAVFEAVHGSAPDIAGKGLANPIAMILSAAMMCHHLGDKDAFLRIRRGVAAVTRKKEHLTPDIGGNAGTREITDAIIAEVKAQPAGSAT